MTPLFQYHFIFQLSYDYKEYSTYQKNKEMPETMEIWEPDFRPKIQHS